MSKSQFESLSEEFALFLALQSIDKIRWDQIKSYNFSLTDKLLYQFSDMVWDRSLEKIIYLENRSDCHLFLFKCKNNSIDLILLEIETDCPFLMNNGYRKWLSKNLLDTRVKIFESTRLLYNNLKEEKYRLMTQGATVSNGEIYEDLKVFLSN